MRDRYEITKTINGYEYTALVLDEANEETKEIVINLFRPIPTNPQKILNRITSKLKPGCRAILVKNARPFSFTCTMTEEEFYNFSPTKSDNFSGMSGED